MINNDDKMKEELQGLMSRSVEQIPLCSNKRIVVFDAGNTKRRVFIELTPDGQTLMIGDYYEKPTTFVKLGEEKLTVANIITEGGE